MIRMSLRNPLFIASPPLIAAYSAALALLVVGGVVPVMAQGAGQQNGRIQGQINGFGNIGGSVFGNSAAGNAPAAAASAAPAAPNAMAAGLPIALAVQMTGSGDNASLVIDLNREIPFEVHALTNPNRLVIDLPRLAFATQSPRKAQRFGPVNSFRFGLFLSDKSRIVLDLAEPAAMLRSDYIQLGAQGRLVIQIGKVSAEKFVEAARKHAPFLPEISTAPPDSATHSTSKPLIMLDPGHGGIDTGASGQHGEIEKSIVFFFAQALKKRLEQGGIFAVEMTRNDDSFVALDERVRLARAKKASFMLSIHADTLTDDTSVRGATLYVLAERASDAQSARLAELENKADILAGVDVKEDQDSVTNILFDLARRETRNITSSYAKELVAHLQPTGNLHRLSLRSARFKVLTAPDVPSILLELGYLTNPENAKQLSSPEWQAKMADAIASALEKQAQEKK